MSACTDSVPSYVWRASTSAKCRATRFCSRMPLPPRRSRALAAISRAPLPEIEAFKRRMGWAFTWVSSYGSDFNCDFRVSFTPEEVARGATIDYEDTLREIWAEEMPGVSVFARDAAGTVFHTYSSYGRGDESLIGAYQYLDLTPNGRNENGPNRNLTDWVRLHDRYDTIGGDADGLGLAAEFAIPPRD